MNVTVYCDTSFNNGVCCTGYIINLPNLVIKSKSSTFYAHNNNEAEITGILIACKAVRSVLELDLHTRITVYNDNIVAVTVADNNYTPSTRAKKKFNVSSVIKDWCRDNNVHLTCRQQKRNTPLMKECDKLSKEYRKKGRRNEPI